MGDGVSAWPVRLRGRQAGSRDDDLGQDGDGDGGDSYLLANIMSVALLLILQRFKVRLNLESHDSRW